MGGWSTKHDMEAKSITDVPNEVIQKFIVIHLSSTDVCSFGLTGVIRFKQIAVIISKPDII